ncbi:glycoside hydrolase superfamily [Lasiosphaeria miniovina]|uniref:beta-galactosidase n=1 Tax=Lasiosphaeria miniovina TaxID=1954250 RepID=A0AA40B4M3_9PEZI|nr:glycoside hydrolase superfamily [Lasiosphaeria miniovina]KAK0727558.1 glycoside hydrolase superfamily [Lasiosphaeria miniovina]
MAPWLCSFAILLPVLQFVLGSQDSWPILGNGLQQTIQWDHYSLIINGERIFLFGGEMHPFRVPVPEVWEDVLQNIKATGMRMVSIYTHWGFHAPTPGKVDFDTGAHNLTRFLEIARDVGLYLNAGGMALWATTGAYGDVRSNETAYTEAWTPYQDGMARLVKPFQITENGTVIMYQIENEYANQWRDVGAKTPNPEAVSYMEKLEENARRNGIVVPMIHNTPGQGGRSWSRDYDTVRARGDVDIYGLDSYPQCWSCVTQDCGTIKDFAIADYWDHFQQVSPRQPPMMPEFQGGAMNPWDGPAGGCKERTGPEFVNLYYRDAIAQKVTTLNLYMMYGGTNWGWLAAPFIGTSYDYSAAIAEDRSIDAKYYKIKNLGLFTRVANELALTERVGNGTAYTNNTAIFVTELRNTDTGAAFYVLRHDITSSASAEYFMLRVNTSAGNFTVPQIQGATVLSGHESRITVVDFNFGNNTLTYSTAEVLTYAIIDGRATFVLWVPTGLSAEFYLQGVANVTVSAHAGAQGITFDKRDEGVVAGFTQPEGMSVLDFDTGAPALTRDPGVPVNQTALVIGPYLVRSASLESDTIRIFGDSNGTTPIEVFTTAATSKIQWNGKDLATTRTGHGTLQATIPPPAAFALPKLGPWKSQDGLPERRPDYSDSSLAWVHANHTTTHSATKGTTPYLYADEYGFHTGVRLWRGYFASTAASNVTGAFVSVQGGTAHAWSAFLNGQPVASFLGDASMPIGNMTISFPSGALHDGDEDGRENVLLVMHDDTGHDELKAALNPRGILNATLLGSDSGGARPQFGRWKVAGTAGGAALDPVRTLYNEGGLAAERLGWHLPGFDDSRWPAGSPREHSGDVGVRFYRTVLELAVPDGLDVSLAFRFVAPPSNFTAYRAYLYVNGYQFGRFYPAVASEDTFPVPPGVLDYSGDNVVAVAVWAQTKLGAAVDVELVLRYAVGSSFSTKFDGAYLRPSWRPERLLYA